MNGAFVEWFAGGGWLWALGGLFVFIAAFVALVFLLPIPADDDTTGGGSF